MRMIRLAGPVQELVANLAMVVFVGEIVECAPTCRTLWLTACHALKCAITLLDGTDRRTRHREARVDGPAHCFVLQGASRLTLHPTTLISVVAGSFQLEDTDEV